MAACVWAGCWSGERTVTQAAPCFQALFTLACQNQAVVHPHHCCGGPYVCSYHRPRRSLSLDAHPRRRPRDAVNPALPRSRGWSAPGGRPSLIASRPASPPHASHPGLLAGSFGAMQVFLYNQRSSFCEQRGRPGWHSPIAVGVRLRPPVLHLNEQLMIPAVVRLRGSHGHRKWNQTRPLGAEDAARNIGIHHAPG